MKRNSRQIILAAVASVLGAGALLLVTPAQKAISDNTFPMGFPGAGGTGSSGVSQLIAGSGIGLSPVGGTGIVTVTATASGGSVTNVSTTATPAWLTSTWATATTTPAQTIGVAGGQPTHQVLGTFAGTTVALGALLAADLPATAVNSVGNLSPLFTAAISAQALNFTLSNAGAHSFFGNNTGATAAPGFQAIGVGDLPTSTVFGPQTLSAHQWFNSLSSLGVLTGTQPAFTDLSGSLAAGQMPGLTGDVTSSAGTVATTIANSAVTNAKMANMAANTIKGNNTGGATAPSDLTVTQVTAMLNQFTSSLKGLVPASGGSTGTHYLDDTGAFSIPAGGGGGGQASVEPAATENPHRSVIQFRYNIDTTAFVSMGTGSAAIGTFNSGAPATSLSNGMDSNGCFGLMGSGATSGNSYGMASGSADECEYQTAPKFWIHFKTITSTNVRYTIGLGRSVGDISGNSVPGAAGVGAWLRFDTGAGDVNWKLITCNGSASSTVTDTGVAFTASDHTAQFDMTNPASISVRIDGGSTTSNTTNLPPASTMLGPLAIAANLASASAQIKVASGWLTQN